MNALQIISLVALVVVSAAAFAGCICWARREEDRRRGDDWEGRGK